MNLQQQGGGDARRRVTANVSISDYLIQRLLDYGIADVFGIPGDYVLSFYSDLERSPVNVVGRTREDCAGFAADAYARINGMGAVCVTYCVGGLSVCNSIAGAYAEKSPVVVISGDPGLGERGGNALLHHMVRDFRTQLEVFEKFTTAGTELSDPLTAFSEIFRVLDAADRFKRPVYIELPRDMVHVVPPVAHGYRGSVRETDAQATAEAVRETMQRLRAAEKPMLIAGVEVHRFRLQDELLRLAETARIPESLARASDGPEHVEPANDDPLRTSRMMRMLNRRLDADTIVIADVGDSLFASAELVIHEYGEFLSPAYYTSMGFSVPASLGTATARKDHRIVVLVGDGAFQMTGQELSSLVRDGHAPVVIILDNHGYGTERYLHEGDWPYNEIQPWDFTKLTEVYGCGESYPGIDRRRIRSRPRKRLARPLAASRDSGQADGKRGQRNVA